MHFAAPRDLEIEILDDEEDALAVFSWAIEPSAPVARTPAEDEVVALLERGASNAEIARVRKTSIRTVANQVSRLLRKLGVHSRYELVRALSGSRRK